MSIQCVRGLLYYNILISKERVQIIIFTNRGGTWEALGENIKPPCRPPVNCIIYFDRPAAVH